MKAKLSIFGSYIHDTTTTQGQEKKPCPSALGLATTWSSQNKITSDKDVDRA